MRLIFASLAALAVVGFAAPSFAQDATPAATPDAAPVTAPVKPAKAAKPKVGTAAYCSTLKTSSSKSACMKRVASAPKSTHKPTKPHAPAKTDTSAMAAPAASTAAVTPAATPTTPPQNVAVPPLPQKTI
jgi:hypothetical protein